MERKIKKIQNCKRLIDNKAKKKGKLRREKKRWKKTLTFPLHTTPLFEFDNTAT